VSIGGSQFEAFPGKKKKKKKLTRPYLKRVGGKRIVVQGWLWTKSARSYLKNKLKLKRLECGSSCRVSA
jgi:hypothetical protein